MKNALTVLLCLSFLCFQAPTHAQKIEKDERSQQFHGLKWRNIGPFRGGRANAITGVLGDPMTYYFGSVGGGIWKTEDAGLSWKNISDGYFKTASVGAIAIAESDQNVIYVGMGEHAVRGVMTSHGDGMYKSVDGGKTWEHIGLEHSRHIAEIRIHPSNPDVVYVAVQGALHMASEDRGVYKSMDGGKTWEHIGLEHSRHIAEIRIHPSNPDVVYVAVQGALHMASEDRGVYKSMDGGKTWKKILYVNEDTGAADISMDVHNPRILYAGMWEHRRYPWQVKSGGEGSGLYKSMDGGATWKKLKKGLPEMMGKVAIDVSPANPDRVFANIEAEGEKGGVYRSDDGGNTWKQTSKDRVTIARSWYYIEIFADPQNPEVVYVLNAPMLKSIDGGKTFKPISNPHSDQHHLWINPQNTDNIALANDGGACITFNGGKTWSTQQNQPTAQFYRVIADNRFPYHVYAGQQDNSTVVISSRTPSSSIGWKDWYAAAGGESAFLAFDPDNPRYVYGGSYQGNISVFDHETGLTKDIMAYPVVGLGTAPTEMKYRFNWNAPIVTSPQNRSVIYHAGNKVLKSTDRGQSWAEISPDLTRNDKEKQVVGGAPFTIEGAGGENYGTITYLVASPHEQGVLWVGTDDGLVQLSKDDGANWEEITPKGLGETQINAIEVSPYDAATAYVAVTSYKFGDFTPMIYVTNDYGKTWKNKVNGIAKEDYVRVVREDPKTKGLLYAGTETGIYVSFDSGEHWERMQLNLPVTPILDLTIQDNDLIAATSGRAFWILDDLSALQQSKGVMDEKLAIYQPKATYKFNVSTPSRAPSTAGQNPASGVIFDYYLPAVNDSSIVQLEILDSKGTVIRSYSSKKDKGFKSFQGGPPAPQVLPAKKGVNRFNWDLRRETLPAVQGVFTLGDYRGGLVAPGTYTLRLTQDETSVETQAKVLANPKIEASQADYEAQEVLLVKVENTVRNIHDAVNDMRKVKKQLVGLKGVLEESEATKILAERAATAIKAIEEWERNLIQPDQKTFQDVINFPNQLNAELMNLKSRADSFFPQPTKGASQRLNDLMEEWNMHRKAMEEIISKDVAAFNTAYEQQRLPAVVVPKVVKP
ncbi:MAG: glycosyl hydrolase [Bacteroidota bacterium]